MTCDVFLCSSVPLFRVTHQTGISDTGVLHAAAVLISIGTSSSLTHIDLGNNIISDRSATALCELLQSVPSITCVEVAGNTVSHILQVSITKLPKP